MKNFIILMILCSLIGIFSLRAFSAKKDDLVKNSFETGCYQFAMYYCSDFKFNYKRKNCYDKAIDFCPKQALKFQKWIKKGE